MHPFVRASVLVCLTVAIVSGGKAIFIHAKAQVAQILLAKAWSESISHQRTVKAWPWADTYPVAKLTVPSMQKEFIVLEGVSGEAMAFGPGRIPGSSRQSSEGVFAIGGHRDTHLAFLETIQDNASVELQTIDGNKQVYRVTKRFVADTRTDTLQLNSERTGLVLVTCYPFHALQPGGPLRFVVVATPVENTMTKASRLVFNSVSL